MRIKRAPDIRSSEITDEKIYLTRREFIQTATGTAAAGATVLAEGGAVLEAATQPAPHGRKFDNVGKSRLSVSAAADKLNTWEQITTYNNYYEFGTDKDSPSQYAKSLRTEPWKVVVEGECHKPAAYNLEDILKGQMLEERIYRFGASKPGRWSFPG
jgi:sulfoxide reductase catalytic subunit YedY